MRDQSPIGWALQPLKKYATFSGRAPRAEFWWFFLFMIIAYFAFWIVMMATFGGLAASQAEPSLGMMGVMGAAGLFMIVFWLALIIPTIAVQVRRLHDTNRSGWWVGGFYLLYIFYVVILFGAMGSAMAGAAGGTSDTSALDAVVLGSGILGLVWMVYAIVLLVFYCLPGSPGTNRYGEDPYRKDVAEVFA